MEGVGQRSRGPRWHRAIHLDGFGPPDLSARRPSVAKCAAELAGRGRLIGPVILSIKIREAGACVFLGFPEEDGPPFRGGDRSPGRPAHTHKHYGHSIKRQADGKSEGQVAGQTSGDGSGRLPRRSKK
jgi:hypothetical protein